MCVFRENMEAVTVKRPKRGWKLTDWKHTGNVFETVRKDSCWLTARSTHNRIITPSIRNEIGFYIYLERADAEDMACTGEYIEEVWFKGKCVYGNLGRFKGVRAEKVLFKQGRQVFYTEYILGKPYTTQVA